jgi:hypothetical protein
MSLLVQRHDAIVRLAEKATGRSACPRSRAAMPGSRRTTLDGGEPATTAFL